MTILPIGKEYARVDAQIEYSRLPLGSGNLADGRPYYRVWDDLCAIYLLDDEMHEWMVERSMEYSMDLELPLRHLVIIPDTRHAMLFKLTWV